MKLQTTLLGATIHLLSGCAAQTFVVSSNTQDEPTKQTSQAFFVNGIGQERVIDAAAICGGADKVLKVQSQETVGNGFLRVLTFGIYTPREAKVYCRK
jgi:hypothetical protein